MDLLNSKDKDVVLNNLRLIMTLIKKPRSGDATIGKKLADEKGKHGEDLILVQRLIKLVKYGPQTTSFHYPIPFCRFPNQINYLAINIIRAFIQYNGKTKSIIMHDKANTVNDLNKDRQKDPSLNVKRIDDPKFLTLILSMIYPDNLKRIDHETQNAILSLLYQLCRDEQTHNKILVSFCHTVKADQDLPDESICFVNCAVERIKKIVQYRKALSEKKKTNIHPSILFNTTTEFKFFKLLWCLGQEDNIRK